MAREPLLAVGGYPSTAEMEGIPTTMFYSSLPQSKTLVYQVEKTR